MKASQLSKRFAKAGKRAVWAGGADAGARRVPSGLRATRFHVTRSSGGLDGQERRSVQCLRRFVGFMEIEAAGGCPAVLRPDGVMSVE